MIVFNEVCKYAVEHADEFKSFDVETPNVGDLVFGIYVDDINDVICHNSDGSLEVTGYTIFRYGIDRFPFISSLKKWISVKHLEKPMTYGRD